MYYFLDFVEDLLEQHILYNYDLLHYEIRMAKKDLMNQDQDLFDHLEEIVHFLILHHLIDLCRLDLHLPSR